MKPIDFQAGNSALSKVFFRVDFANIETSKKESGVFDNATNGIQIKDYKAIVNLDNNDILCVVSKSYHLIKHEDALNIGKKVFSKLFPSVAEKDWKVYKVIAPLKGTFCHIDLIHENVNLATWNQDTWYPFLRVTNSYNRTFALSFELGFVRKLCANGVIFSKKTVKIKFNHSQANLSPDINVDVSDLKLLEEEFKNRLFNLNRFFVPKKYIFALVIKATGITFNTNSTNLKFRDQELRKLTQLKELTLSLSKEYIDSIGENALAAFNTITDIISNHDRYNILPNYSLNANRYYHNVSQWMKEYTDEAEKRDFSIEKYLDKEQKYFLLN